jgi:hypothetical protein
MRRTLLLLCILFTAFSFAGNDEQWELYKSVDGVEIYYTKQNCDDPANGLFQSYLIFKYVNTNSEEVELNYVINYTWNGHYYAGANSDEPVHTFSIPANSEVEGTCGDRSLSIFVEFTDHLDRGTLDSFSLDNLTVTK